MDETLPPAINIGVLFWKKKTVLAAKRSRMQGQLAAQKTEAGLGCFYPASLSQKSLSGLQQIRSRKKAPFNVFSISWIIIYNNKIIVCSESRSCIWPKEARNPDRIT